jgi:ribosomal protein L7/L12
VSAEVKALADNPSNKIAAIKLHREETGVGLAEAKAAVEAYTAGRG